MGKYNYLERRRSWPEIFIPVLFDDPYDKLCITPYKDLKRIQDSQDLLEQDKSVLLRILLAKDPTKITTQHLAKYSATGEKGIKHCIDRLRHHGYLLLVQIRDEKKRIKGYTRIPAWSPVAMRKALADKGLDNLVKKAISLKWASGSRSLKWASGLPNNIIYRYKFTLLESFPSEKSRILRLSDDPTETTDKRPKKRKGRAPINQINPDQYKAEIDGIIKYWNDMDTEPLKYRGYHWRKHKIGRTKIMTKIRLALHQIITNGTSPVSIKRAISHWHKLLQQPLCIINSRSAFGQQMGLDVFIGRKVRIDFMQILMNHKPAIPMGSKKSFLAHALGGWKPLCSVFLKKDPNKEITDEIIKTWNRRYRDKCTPEQAIVASKLFMEMYNERYKQHFKSPMSLLPIYEQVFEDFGPAKAQRLTFPKTYTHYIPQSINRKYNREW